MQKVKKTVERTIKEETTVYVANDGAEFRTEAECDCYEAALLREALHKRDDIVFNDKAGSPCDGDTYRGPDYEFVWVKPLSEEAVNLLYEAYNSDWVQPDDFKVNQWTCLELDYDDMASAISFEAVMNEIKGQFGELGYDVEFIERVKGK